VKLPVEPEHESPEVPEDPGVMVTLAGVRVQDRPVEGDAEELRFTAPGNALTEETVIVDVAAEPALAVKLTGFAEIEKSGTAALYVTVAIWERVLLVALTVTVYEPGVDGLQDSVEEPEFPAIVIVVVLKLQLIPLVGDDVAIRVTVPPKPLDVLTVIVESSVEPILPVTLVGFALTVKSSIAIAAVVE